MTSLKSATDAETRRTAWRLGLALFLIYVLATWAGPPLDPMAGRAIALSEAFSHGRLRVQGPETVLSGDFLFPDGRSGGGVAISEFGGPALFAPVCLAVRAVLPSEGPLARRRVIFVESALYVALLSALPAALAAALMFLLLMRLAVPMALPAALLFGLTPLFPQASVVSPHPLSTALTCAALLLLVDPERSIRASALAGLAAGAAVLAYFGALLPVAIPIGIYGIATGSRRSRLAFVAGAAGPALLLALWNHLNYGAPWALPDLSQGMGGTADVGARTATFTLSLPSPRLLWEVCVGARRGLLVFAPVLVLGIAGLKPLWRRRRDLALLLIAIVAGAVLQAASKPISWHGGTAAGPRYLIPAALALSVSLGYGLVAFRRLGTALGGLSIGFALCTALAGLYGSLRGCVEEMVFLGPRLRWVYSVAHQLEISPVDHGWALVISATVGLSVLLGALRILRHDLPAARRAAAVLTVTWLALALRVGVVGPLERGPMAIRHAEVLRLVQSEPEPLRLRWYAVELLTLGDPLGAAETSLDAIEREGWGRDAEALRVLGRAIRKLDQEGRKVEAQRMLTRAARLKGG